MIRRKKLFQINWLISTCSSKITYITGPHKILGKYLRRNAVSGNIRISCSSVDLVWGPHVSRTGPHISDVFLPQETWTLSEQRKSAAKKHQSSKIENQNSKYWDEISIVSFINKDIFNIVRSNII